MGVVSFYFSLSAAPVWAQARLPESLRTYVESKSIAARRRHRARHARRSARAGRAPRAAHQENAERRRGARRRMPPASRRWRADVDHLSRDVEVTSFMAVDERRDWRRPGAGRARGSFVRLRARASASRSSTRASGPATARSPGAWSSQRISSATTRRATPGHRASGLKDDPYGHGTHIGATSRAARRIPQDSTSQTPFRGVAPGANLISLRVIGADGTGKASDVIDAIEWAIQNRQALQHPRHQPVARRAGRAVLPGRPDVRGRRARGARGHRRRGGGGQSRQGRRREQRVRADRVAGHRSVRDYGGRAQHEGHGAAVGRRADDVQLEGADAGGGLV